MGPGILSPILPIDREVTVKLAASKKVAEATTLLNVSQYNYFHFLAQSLPSLASMQSRLPKSVPVTMGGEFSTGNLFGAQLMHLLFPELQFNFLHVGYSLYADCMTSIPPITTNLFEPTGIELVRDRGRFVVSRDQAKSGSGVVYLARGDQERNRRRLINEHEVIALLRKKWPALDVFVPGLMTVEEQIFALANSQVIIGLHGSQLTNIMWAPPNASVIEIIPDDLDTSDLFAALGKVLGLNYFAARSTGIDDSHWSVTDQVADLEGISTILKHIF
jgi:hypothetical protein